MRGAAKMFERSNSEEERREPVRWGAGELGEEELGHIWGEGEEGRKVGVHCGEKD